MNRKTQVAWRAYLFFLVCIVLIAAVIGKVVYLQTEKKAYWENVSEQFHTRIQTFQAPRGSIYSEDERLLSVSIPKYHLYADLGLPNLQKNGGKLFFLNLNDLCHKLATLRSQFTYKTYREKLLANFQDKKRYVKILSHLTFEEYQKVKKFPLVKLPRYKGGFILEKEEIRSYPYGQMAKRTIGLYRKKQNLVGLEKKYNDWLQGTSGKRILRKIAQGVYIPVDGSEVDPLPGKNIVTTLSANIQDAVDAALLKKLIQQESEWGTCIVMEVATGKIKAISNLKRNEDGSYSEAYNYAVLNVEPGSTMKTLAYMALIEDELISLQDTVHIHKGQWFYNGIKIQDSDYGNQKKKNFCTIQEAFELSSNVGVARLVNKHYGKNPAQYSHHLKKANIHKLASIQIPGEHSPYIKMPHTDAWSPTSLLWMSFGYEMKISPLSVLTYYNAIANNGKLMKPYIVKELQDQNGNLITTEPQVSKRAICSRHTIRKIHQLLEGAVNNGTAKNISKTWYGIAGKTGTSIVYTQKDGYDNDQYLSSFAGYFPAKNPLYSCVVFVQNKPHAHQYYGAQIAAPVLKEVADKIMAQNYHVPVDELIAKYQKTAKNKTPQPSLTKEEIVSAYQQQKVPDMKGWKLADAIFFAENNNIKIDPIKGGGKIIKQSIQAGTSIRKEEMTMALELR